MKAKSKLKTTNKISDFISRVDPSLEKYKNMDLFKDKVEEMTAIVKKFGLPKMKA